MSQDRAKGAALTVLAGSVLAVVGCLTSWIQADTGFGTVSRSGLDWSGDAKFILVAAVVTGLASVARLAGWTLPALIRPSSGIVGAVTTALAVYDYTQVRDRVSAGATAGVSMRAGAGLYVTIVGGLLMLLGGYALFELARREKGHVDDVVASPMPQFSVRD